MHSRSATSFNAASVTPHPSGTIELGWSWRSSPGHNVLATRGSTRGLVSSGLISQGSPSGQTRGTFAGVRVTELREGDLVQIRQICRTASYVGEVGLVVEIEERARLQPHIPVAWIGVAWPHVADTRWYCISDLVKVTG